MFYQPKKNPFSIDPYKSLIFPRPIGWISSIDKKGIVNLAPYSYFNAIADDPPQIMFVVGASDKPSQKKDTLTNIIETKEFVVNFATTATRKQMNLSSKDIDKDDEVLVRVHSQCLTGDILGSQRCDCGDQLEESLKKIESFGKGVLVYLRQEGRGIGLKNKLLAYQLQDTGLDTVEANEKLGFAPDLREYGIGAQILRECNVRKMRLLTNNPRKIIGLEEGYGLKIINRESIEIESNCVNKPYLQTKRDKLGHFLSTDSDE